MKWFGMLVVGTVAFAGNVETITGDAAAKLYKQLPGPVVEISPTVHRKYSRDRLIVCTKSDYMLGENDYDCEIHSQEE